MLSDFQTIVERSKTKVANESVCEKTSETHSSFDINPTITTQTLVEEEDVFSKKNFSKYCRRHIPSKQMQ